MDDLGLHVILEHVEAGNLGAVGAMKVFLAIIVTELPADNTAGPGRALDIANPLDLWTE